MRIQSKLHVWGNSLGLIAVCALFILAFADQILNNDLPCPLCLLQRVCFAGIGICLMMNLRLGIKASHYGMMLVQAFLGLTIATRQIYLHLAPNDPGFGNTLLGLHFYTWAAIAFVLISLFIAVALILEAGLNPEYKTDNKWLIALMCFFLLLILANGVSTFIQCGPYRCPDMPTSYYLLNNHAGL